MTENKKIKENEEVMLLPREAKDFVQKGWILKRLAVKYDDTGKPRKYFVVGKLDKSSKKELIENK
jgi:hypothetical protein